MVLALGAGVGRGGVRTPAFDLGLVAYLSGVRPGETVELLSRRDTSSIMSVLESLAGDLGAPDLVASLGTSAIKALVDLAITAYTRHRELARIDRLGRLLERCRAIVAGDPAPTSSSTWPGC